jgi:hypothetical protein
MWPTPRADAFDSPDFLFEPSWGGHRALAFVEPADAAGGGEVRLVDPAGHELVGRLPELAGLAVRLGTPRGQVTSEKARSDNSQGGSQPTEAP